MATTCIIIFTSCEEEKLFADNARHHFYVRNNKCDLAVSVQGKTNSKTFIVFIHGGPEVGAIAESDDSEFWNKLEEQYAIVYYDQRGMGMSNGNFDELTLTVEQSVNDLDKIILVLKDRYGEDISVFLLGGSWGGYLGTAYITTSDYQNKIKGWIEIGGAHNMKLIQSQNPQLIKQTASQQINKNKSVRKWEALLSFADVYDTTDIGFDNWLILNQKYAQIVELLEKDGELKLRKTKINIPGEINIVSLWANDNVNKTGLKLLKKYYNTSLSARLKIVTIPCRFFWGEYDFAVSPALAFDAYTNISTPPKNKEVKIFKNAEHTILLTKPYELLHEIEAFVESYR